MERNKNLNLLFLLSIFPEDLKDQIAILSLYFPRIKVPQEIPYTSAFAFINWRSVTKNYQSALKKAIQALKRNFEVHLEINLERIEKKEDLKAKEDIFWGKVELFENLSAQAMKKMRETKKGCFLGIFETACLILTHFGKFPETIGFNCIGDRYYPSYPGSELRKHLIYHPYIYISKNHLWIRYEWERVIRINHLNPVFSF